MRGFVATLLLCLVVCVSTGADAKARHHRHHHFAHHNRHHVVVASNVAEGVGHGLLRILKDLENTRGMNDDFVAKLKTAFNQIGDGTCRVGSGYRSHAEQAALHRAKPGLAAAPGHSNHELGLAADLSCRGAGLRWMHAHAREYGLTFPMAYEPWHIEPIGATRFASHRHKHFAAHHRYRHYARAG